MKDWLRDDWKSVLAMLITFALIVAASLWAREHLLATQCAVYLSSK